MHIWIIMDWNRRWAKSRFLPAVAGHKAWAENVKKIVEEAWKLWVKYLTLWALSVDNLQKREKDEVENIIKLIDNIENFLWEYIGTPKSFKLIYDRKKRSKDQ